MVVILLNELLHLLLGEGNHFGILHLLLANCHMGISES